MVANWAQTEMNAGWQHNVKKAHFSMNNNISDISIRQFITWGLKLVRWHAEYKSVVHLTRLLVWPHNLYLIRIWVYEVHEHFSKSKCYKITKSTQQSFFIFCFLSFDVCGMSGMSLHRSKKLSMQLSLDWSYQALWPHQIIFNNFL